VGATFGPEAYHFFPFFAVAYTSVMVLLVKQLDNQPAPEPVASGWRRKMMRSYGAEGKRQPAVTVPRGTGRNSPLY
jgi:hypothetical protein